MKKFMCFIMILSCVWMHQPYDTYASAVGTTYYVDQVNGNDSNDGLSSSSPWKSIDKVSSLTYQAGDQILFKASGIWTGQWTVKGSGTSENPIRIGTYGEGSKPVINGMGISGGVIQIFNEEYWTIDGIEITNDDGTGINNGKNFNGILVEVRDGYVADGIRITNCDLHHVNGDHWGHNASNPWTAAIVMRANGADNGQKFNDAVIENCRITDTRGRGILIGWDEGSGQYRTKFTDITVRNNYIDNTGGTGVFFFDVDGGVFENNTLYRNGANGQNWLNATVAAFPIKCTNLLWQNNEIAYQVDSADSTGHDIDWGCEGSIIYQYNYSHDNPGGWFLLFFTRPNKAIDFHIRYNVSINDGGSTYGSYTGPISWFDNRMTDVNRDQVKVYNNTIFHTSGGPYIQNRNGVDTQFTNNIFNGIGQSGTYPSNTTFNNNCYYGHVANVNDANKVTGNPAFLSPTDGGIDSSCDGYQLTGTSSCVDSGVVIADNGGKDYWGNTLYNRLPDIGAHEYQGEVTVPEIPIGKSISLKATINDKYLNVNANTLDLEANSTSVSEWATFYVEDAYNGWVRLRSKEGPHGGYIRAISGEPESPCDAEGGTGTWTKWRWVVVDETHVRLESYINQGQYLRVDMNDSTPHVDSQGSGDEWTEFLWELQ